MSTEVQSPSTTYRISAMGAGLRAMWRAAGPALIFIVINTVIQAGLVYVDTQSGFTLEFLVAFLVSAVSALILYAVLTACAAQSVDGTASFGSVMARTKRHLGSFSLWAVVQWLLIMLAAIIHPLLVLLVAVITPFLPIAAMDGQRNALAQNFRVLGKKFGRWLVTVVVLLIAGMVLYLLAAVNVFFVKGTPAAVFFWLVIGVIAWWLLTAWTLIYRNAD